MILFSVLRRKCLKNDKNALKQTNIPLCNSILKLKHLNNQLVETMKSSVYLAPYLLLLKSIYSDVIVIKAGRGAAG